MLMRHSQEQDETELGKTGGRTCRTKTTIVRIQGCGSAKCCVHRGCVSGLPIGADSTGLCETEAPSRMPPR